MSAPGPHTKEDVESVSQRVHIRSCFLEDVAIGNRNRMRVITGAAGGGGAGPEDSDGDPGEPAEDTGKPGPFESPISQNLGVSGAS